MIASPELRAVRAEARRRRRLVLALLSTMVLGVIGLSLCVGHSFVPPGAVIAALTGAADGGEAFTIRVLRAPRAVLACLAGMCFGMGGAAFQTLLRNPLASPDIIGISAGASAAAVWCIVVLGLSGMAVSVAAVTAGLGVAALIYVLAWRGGTAGTRLILVGIGISAMLQSFIAYVLTQAPSWSLLEALRWMTGSLNAAQIDQAMPLAVALAVFGGVLFALRRDLETMRMGDDTAAGLGVAIDRVRAIVICAATALVAFATAAAGPVAFVAFLSGPIAARLAYRGGSILVPAALTGAALVLLADFAGQVLLPTRYPVGIVTGMLGAPYLVLLIVRDNRRGTSL